MAGVRVDRLALRLVAPAALRPAAARLRARAEAGFLPALLQALAQRLQQLYGPDAVLHIPALRLRLRMPASGLEGAAWVERVSEDLAAQVQSWVERQPAGGSPAQPQRGARLFRDSAHEGAVRLLAAARGEPGPAGDTERFDDVWRAAAALPAHERAPLLLACAGLEDGAALLARWTAADIERVLQCLPAAAPAAWVQALRRTLRSRHAAAARGARQAREDAQAPWASVPTDEVSAASRALRSGASDGQRAQGPMAPRASLRTSAPPADASHEPAQPADGAAARPAAAAPPGALPQNAIAHGFPALAPRGQAAAPALPVPAPVAPPDGPAPTAAAPVAKLSEPTRAQAHAPSAELAADSESIAQWPTRWAGLPYLLNIGLRLEWPERLWQVGLPEGDVLAAMLARLSGTPDDPAVRLLSPAFPDAAAPLPPVPAWARDELEAGVRAAAAGWPAVAADLPALHARVAELQAWYADGADHDLAAWAAAWHLALAEVLLGERLAPPELARRFGGAGVIEREGDLLRVVQPLEAVDIDIRRAGLDADPGWLPWLRRRLVFVFEGREDLDA